MTDDPSESNPTFLRIPLLNRVCGISYPLIFSGGGKGLYLVWHLEGFFLAFQMSLLEFVFSLLVLILSCKTQLLVPLAN